MKSFDEWFSEQGSSQEEPQAEQELAPGLYKAKVESVEQVGDTVVANIAIEGYAKRLKEMTPQEINDLVHTYNPLFKKIEDRQREREKELERQISEPNFEVVTIKRPGKQNLYLPKRVKFVSPTFEAQEEKQDSLKWDVYEEKLTKDGKFIRQGNTIHCFLRWNSQVLAYSLDYYNEVLHKQHPETYPRFEP